jgi:uncharacterized membrane protein YeaQ/YmgE (transglycosylase-associated protein family)
MTIVIGGLAGHVMRGSGYGIVGDIVVGLLGAFVGNWLLQTMNFTIHLGNALVDRMVVALLGAVFLMFVVSLFRPRSLRKRVTDLWRRR